MTTTCTRVYDEAPDRISAGTRRVDERVLRAMTDKDLRAGAD
jgi:hypothetical protein